MKEKPSEEEIKQIKIEIQKEKEEKQKSLNRAQKKNEQSGQKKFGEDTEDWHKTVAMTQ